MVPIPPYHILQKIISLFTKSFYLFYSTIANIFQIKMCDEITPPHMLHAMGTVLTSITLSMLIYYSHIWRVYVALHNAYNSFQNHNNVAFQSQQRNPGASMGWVSLENDKSSLR